MEIIVNGEKKNLQQEIGLIQFLKSFEFPSERIAIEINKKVIRKKDWPDTILNDADKIEIIHFVGGG